MRRVDEDALRTQASFRSVFAKSVPVQRSGWPASFATA